MVSSYTANLAAFLTVQNLTSPIKSVENLKECGLPDKECPVKFGAKKDGTTLKFFKDAEHPTYRNMYAYMMAHPDEMTTDNLQGLERANNEDYAFLMESSSIEYIIERNCNGNLIGHYSRLNKMLKIPSSRSQSHSWAIRLMKRVTASQCAKVND